MSLKQAIELKNIKNQGLHRLTNAKGRETTLIIFKVENEIQANLLKRNGVMYNNRKYRINEYSYKSKEFATILSSDDVWKAAFIEESIKNGFRR